jgi:hypothetical protein
MICARISPASYLQMRTPVTSGFTRIDQTRTNVDLLQELSWWLPNNGRESPGRNGPFTPPVDNRVAHAIQTHFFATLKASRRFGRHLVDTSSLSRNGPATRWASPTVKRLRPVIRQNEPTNERFWGSVLRSVAGTASDLLSIVEAARRTNAVGHGWSATVRALDNLHGSLEFIVRGTSSVATHFRRAFLGNTHGFFFLSTAL